MYESYYDYGSYYRSTDPTPFLIISIVAAFIATILLFILVLPDKKRANLNGFFKGIADIFNFRTLLIEKIVKFLYTFTTIAAILFGFFMLFMQEFGRSLALYGLLVMFISPIAIRLLFEITMMAILLVKNVIEINNKLGYKNSDDKGNTASPFAEPKLPKKVEAPVQPKAPAAPAQPKTPSVCATCGTLRANENAPFCTNCGAKF
ncbi:MAG: hypothetical protein IJA21_03990 [Clostridia bacterium]|nr:hypothetical protein [Clostridia bacterium]